MPNELYDGTRVVTAAAGATALAADYNTFQDQVILGVEARWRDVPITSGVLGDAGGWSMQWTAGNAPYWLTTGANSELLFPVFFRDDEYLTSASAWVKSDNGDNPTNGSINLWKTDYRGTSSSSVTNFGATGHFWDTDAAGVTEVTSGAITVTIDTDNYYYFIGVEGPDGGVGNTYLYGLQLRTRFHVGA